jgi:uncharacterized protein YdeI (YjbR/CyaY-like superfamily)
MSRDARIDAYIESRPDFARPILTYLREAVHCACPAVDETIKWRMPSFTYKGKILAVMAGFKAHATFGFWRSAEVVGESSAAHAAMGQFGRITAIEDLPDRETLDALIRKAVALLDSGTKPAPATKAPKPEPEMPDDLRNALDAVPAAASAFQAFPPSCRREYIEWVVEAKRPETRQKRIHEAVEWVAEGKRRNWKYENC